MTSICFAMGASYKSCHASLDTVADNPPKYVCETTLAGWALVTASSAEVPGTGTDKSLAPVALSQMEQ